jgi:hypothetical protein
LKEGSIHEENELFNRDFFFWKGFKWVRRLNYQGKLTMHTAYERKENPSPAAVTALGISK